MVRLAEWGLSKRCRLLGVLLRGGWQQQGRMDAGLPCCTTEICPQRRQAKGGARVQGRVEQLHRASFATGSTADITARCGNSGTNSFKFAGCVNSSADSHDLIGYVNSTSGTADTICSNTRGGATSGPRGLDCASSASSVYARRDQPPSWRAGQGQSRSLQFPERTGHYNGQDFQPTG